MDYRPVGSVSIGSGGGTTKIGGYVDSVSAYSGGGGGGAAPLPPQPRTRNSATEVLHATDRRAQACFFQVLSDTNTNARTSEIDAALRQSPVLSFHTPIQRRALAKTLVHAEAEGIENSPPVKKGQSGRPHALALTRRHAFVHLKTEMGRGHAKVAYSAARIDRRTLEVTPVVHKKVIGDNPSHLGETRREILVFRLLAKYNLPFIADAPLALFQYVSDSGTDRIALYEAAYDGTLADHLFNLLEDKLSALRDLARALEGLASLDLVHCDVTPDNVFVDLRDRHVYLGDLSAVSAHNSRGQSHRGNRTFRPPEEFRATHAQPRKEGDIWSLGLVAHQVFMGYLPSFMARVWKPEILAAAREKRVPILNEPAISSGLFLGWPETSDQVARLQTLIRRCIHLPPETRPTAKDVALALESEIATSQQS